MHDTMRHRLATLSLLLLTSLTLAGCEVIADIFQAGFWVGVIVVLIVLFFIWLLVRWLG